MPSDHRMAAPVWRSPHRSAANGNCVEVASLTSREATTVALIADLRPLWDQLDAIRQSTADALAADDWQAWVEGAVRGAEIHQQIARRVGWQKDRKAIPDA